MIPLNAENRPSIILITEERKIMKINNTNPIKFSLPHQLRRTHALRQRLFNSIKETLNMSDKTHLERGSTGRSKRAGVRRHARQALALAVVMLMVCGSWIVKVGAAAGDLDL